MARAFPQPWTFEENSNACFIVRDANKFPVDGAPQQTS
jgi:hypothetical protein